MRPFHRLLQMVEHVGGCNKIIPSTADHDRNEGQTAVQSHLDLVQGGRVRRQVPGEQDDASLALVDEEDSLLATTHRTAAFQPHREFGPEHTCMLDGVGLAAADKDGALPVDVVLPQHAIQWHRGLPLRRRVAARLLLRVCVELALPHNAPSRLYGHSLNYILHHCHGRVVARMRAEHDSVIFVCIESLNACGLQERQIRAQLLLQHDKTRRVELAHGFFQLLDVVTRIVEHEATIRQGQHDDGDADS
mmetsp:Transcript_51571/g.142760  ORF Transcript_51571/g.142760 Transcript_51571/m.142760 type:complete len:248 (+) Transcript_51571:1035-1778(+)